MMKVFLFLAALCPAAFGFELSRDTLESDWTAGDSVWLVNRESRQARISSLYVKRLSGPLGNGLVFKISNLPPNKIGGFSHWYQLQAIGDSLYEPPGRPDDNPDILIPPRDSVHLKNVIYGSCLFCVSSAAPFNYSIELNFVESGRAPVKLVVVGNFVSGVARRAAVTPGPNLGSGRSYRVDGRELSTGTGPSPANRTAIRRPRAATHR